MFEDERFDKRAFLRSRPGLLPKLQRTKLYLQWSGQKIRRYVEGIGQGARTLELGII